MRWTWPRWACKGPSPARALRAIQKHVLAQASLTGTYTLNPALAPKQIRATSAS